MKRPAYPSIENTIRELLYTNNPTYDYFVKYLSRYPDNTWMYILEHELIFIFNTICEINKNMRFYFVLDKTSHNYKYSNGRNIYHVLSEYNDIIEDLDNLKEFIRIIDTYFTEDINKISRDNHSPLDDILGNIYLDDCSLESSKQIIKIFYDRGAIITHDLLENAKKLNQDLYDFILELSYPDVKYPGYD